MDPGFRRDDGRKWLTLLIWLLPACAHAADSVPLFFTRSELIIQRAALPASEAPLPWQSIAPADLALSFDIELRDGGALYQQKGWFSLDMPADGTGMLLYFGAPILAPIPPASQYAPLDILLLDGQGRIAHIFPNLVLAELTEEIESPSPVVAFLIVRGGLCEARGIRSGDTVEHPLFKKPPVMK